MSNPRLGDVISGTAGARKLRVKVAGRGKSRGVRTIYVYLRRVSKFYFLITYGKNESDDLSDSEKQSVAKRIRRLEEEADMRLRMVLGLGPTPFYKVTVRLDA
ncbi:MAG: type II toxin-antitoxin system RelE/ParE family toxin [Actinobacteria bacterium]|nr:type II toxin-antitoxin system RelE/ParE family toxin [Actinomycetota bacterium]